MLHEFLLRKINTCVEYISNVYMFLMLLRTKTIHTQVCSMWGRLPNYTNLKKNIPNAFSRYYCIFIMFELE